MHVIYISTPQTQLTPSPPNTYSTSIHKTSISLHTLIQQLRFGEIENSMKIDALGIFRIFRRKRDRLSAGDKKFYQCLLLHATRKMTCIQYISTWMQTHIHAYAHRHTPHLVLSLSRDILLSSGPTSPLGLFSHRICNREKSSFVSEST